MLIELYEGFFVESDFVAVVKSTGKDQCALFTPGQSAVDEGFTIPYEAAEVAEKINDAMEGYDSEEGDDEDEDETK